MALFIHKILCKKKVENLRMNNGQTKVSNEKMPDEICNGQLPLI